MAANFKPPLGVTTSDRVDSELRRRARELALEHGLPYLERTHKSPLANLVGNSVEAMLVLEAKAVLLVDSQDSLRFSEGMAHLRIQRFDAGARDDLLLRTAELEEGESVLDCTLGLGADSLVAARAVGPSGRVVGLEKSLPLSLLVREGLAGMVRHPQSASIQVLHGDAAEFLRAQPDASFDCVLFDPMFERKRKSSHAFAVLRRYADHAELTQEMVTQAQRVARRVVVLKGSRYSKDFKKLGIRPEPARPNATILWARLPAASSPAPSSKP